MTRPSPALLYVVAGCPHCTAARTDLTNRGIPFTEIDVGTRRQAVPELLKLTAGRRIVPVIVQDGRIAIAPHGGTTF